MWLKERFKARQQSVIVKVTLWYSLLLFALLTVVIGGAYVVSGQWSERQAQLEMREKLQDLSHDLEDFEPFDDGIYFGYYDDKNQLIDGHFPQDFDSSLPYSDNALRDVKRGQSTYQYMDIKVVDEGGWLRAVRFKQVISKELRFFLLALVIFLPLFLGLMVVGGYRILKRSFLPVESMSRTALDISQHHDYSRRIAVPSSRDELSRLAQTFNQMLSSIEASFIREKDFTNNASHELRTPIAVIMAESEYGKSYASNLAEAKESHEIIYQQASTMKALIEQLLTLARGGRFERQSLQALSLSELVSNWYASKQRLLADKGIKGRLDLDQDLWVKGDSLLLERLLDNLMSNALKFTKDEIALSLKSAGDTIILSVSDNGIGMEEAELGKVWERFYQVDRVRTRSEERGVGLGLALVADIAKCHGAEYRIASQLDCGTMVSITFKKESLPDER